MIVEGIVFGFGNYIVLFWNVGFVICGFVILVLGVVELYLRDDVEGCGVWVFVLSSDLEKKFIWIIWFFGCFNVDVLVLVFVEGIGV